MKIETKNKSKALAGQCSVKSRNRTFHIRLKIVTSNLTLLQGKKILLIIECQTNAATCLHFSFDNCRCKLYIFLKEVGSCTCPAAGLKP